MSCFLLSPRAFSALSSPNSIVVVLLVVFVFRKLKLFCTGGGVDWNCLNVGGDALNVSGYGGWKGGGGHWKGGGGWKGDGSDDGGKLLLLLSLELKNVGLFLMRWAYFVSMSTVLGAFFIKMLATSFFSEVKFF